MVRLNVAGPAEPTLLKTLAENVNVPWVVGVPLMVPLLFSVNPGGNVPDAKVQVMGAAPAAFSDAEYGVPCAPETTGEVLVI